MVQTRQDRHGNYARHGIICLWRDSAARNVLIDSLVRTVIIVVVHVFTDDVTHMAFIQNDEVVEALTA